MGLHTGEPTVGEERYLGLGVHKAARIGAAAHGGQTPLSNATRELVEDELPPDLHAYQTWASTGSRTSIVPNGSFS
jgi:class 3 adenylate cyclase